MYAYSHECPNCGAPVPFASAIAVFAVCGHCRSSVVRRDAQVELMGVQAQLPPDISPLKIGTTGSFDGRGFTIIGRVRVGYREGTWNEWCADFGEGLWGWVAEAQGHYMVSFEVAPPETLPGMQEIRERESRPEGALGLKDFRLSQGRSAMPVGKRVTLSGTEYAVRDTKQTEILFSEGSLPFVAVPGRSAISADLGAPGRAFANVEYSEEGIRVFLGRYCTFAELGFQELRALPGWNGVPADPERRSAEALNCPTCGAAMEVRAAGLSMVAACGSCGSLVDTSHAAVQLLATARARTQVFRPLIPIGRRGQLGGVEYECIGFMRRRDNHGEAWFEYLLFNPYGGFRWLVTYSGHWSLVDLCLEEPADAAEYKLFANSTAEVTYVLGEFYWQVRHGERVMVSDFIAPPRVLSSERYPDLAEVTWSQGEYVEGKVVREAFGIEGEFPEAQGLYLNQPNPHEGKGRTLRRLLPILAVVFVVVSLIGAVARDRERVWEANYVYGEQGTNGAIVTEPIVLKGSHPQALAVTLSAEVDNSWLETEIDFVNEATGQVEREMVVGVDFWSGNDGGYWEEGSRKRSVIVPAMPPGRYRLVIEPSMEPVRRDFGFRLELVRDVMVWSNLWLGLAGLLAYPFYRWYREHSFERERWAMSDQSPHLSISEMLATAGDDDE